MAKALFITVEDLKRFSIVDGNMDEDKIIQFISTAQDLHIQNYLGTDLFNKIAADIVASTLVSPYSELLETYIKPMTIYWSMVEILPWIAYTIANKGVYKHSSENSETVSKEEVDFLVENSRSTANNYTRRFIDYMCYNSTTFPEYNSNTNEDIKPDKTADFTGWVL
jgi:hypothetical protein